jgi:O-antigen/teichoic acid export membrane protein
MTAVLVFAGSVILACPLLLPVLQRAIPPLASQPRLSFWMLVAAATQSVWFTVRALEQAQLRFLRCAIYTVAYGVLRFVPFAAVILFPKATPKMDATFIFCSLYVWPFGVLLIFPCAHVVRNFHRIILERTHIAMFRSALKYGGWIIASSLVFNFSGRLPQLELAWKRVSLDLGYYSAALTFVSGLYMLNDAVRAVLTPMASGILTRDGRLAFRRRVWRLLPIYWLCTGGGMLALAVLQDWILGGKYSRAMPVFLIVGTSTIGSTSLGFVNTLIHSHGAPQLDFSANLLRLTALGIGFLFVPCDALAYASLSGVVLLASEIGLYIVVEKRDLLPTPELC